MDFTKPKQTLNGLHQFLVQANWERAIETSDGSELGVEIQQQGFEEIFLLLHGYSEDGTRIYRRLGRHLQDNFKNKKIAILAPNGLYPMPKAFPLSGEVKTAQELLQGFAWYFYHAATNTFLIDYKVPTVTLSTWLKALNPTNLPVTVIGYSQGGYLAPFVAMEYAKHGPLKRVIGINCSFREDLMEETPQFPLDLVQGREDTIIETELAHQRFLKLKKRGITGDYHWVDKADHKLTADVASQVIDLL